MMNSMTFARIVMSYLPSGRKEVLSCGAAKRFLHFDWSNLPIANKICYAGTGASGTLNNGK